MTTRILHKKTAVEDRKPIADDVAGNGLQYGELAINYNENSPTLYIRDSADNIIEFSPGGNASVHVGGAPPAEPNAVGDLWWDSESGTLYIYYEDTDSSQWVPASPQGHGNDGTDGDGTSVEISPTPPAPPNAVGDLWWDSTSGILYIYYKDADSSQWVPASPQGGGSDNGGNVGTVTRVTGTAPIEVTSTTSTPVVSITEATTALAGAMSAADKEKLDGIEEEANKYELPKATETALGGVKVSSAENVNITSDGVLYANIPAGLNYVSQIDCTVDTAPAAASNGDFYVNTETGVVEASWNGIAGENIQEGDRVLFNAVGEWEIMPIGISQRDEIYSGVVPPSEPVLNDLWFDTASARHFIRQNDASGDGIWVQMV